MFSARSRKLPRKATGVVLAIACILGALAPTALAAASNDEFANRNDLGAALPVRVSETNVGATREAGEPQIGSLGDSGHSLWWEWEAAADGWTTFSACESSFSTVLGVYEGTELEHLTRVAQGNADEGPRCQYSGEVYTFWAEAGHHYVIGVDGNPFYVPDAEETVEKPSGEGEITLTIERTPIPPNDDLANATPVGTLSEGHQNPFEEQIEDRFLRTQLYGYNWGATEELEEPHLPEDPVASVWYSWTPTASGELWMDTEAGGPEGYVVALYRGSAFSNLELVAEGSGEWPALRAQVTAGTEYRIAVDGIRSEATGEPHMGTFSLNLELRVPPGSEDSSNASATLDPNAQSSSESGSVTPPTTKLGSHKVDAAKGTATFRFSSSTRGATFRCRVDKKSFKTCSSPYKVKGLKSGKHRFEVVAGYDGASDRTPAVVHFTVPAVRRHSHRAG